MKLRLPVSAPVFLTGCISDSKQEKYTTRLRAICMSHGNGQHHRRLSDFGVKIEHMNRLQRAVVYSRCIRESAQSSRD